MTAPFIPPPIDSSAPTVGTLSSLSLPALEETGPVANTAPIVPGQPRPVVPAEEIGVPPAKALDPVAGGPGLFEKAKEIGMPYIQKIQETTKPYVDAAEHKAEELFEKLEHKLDGTSSTGLKSTTTSTTEVSPTGTVNDIKPAPYAAGPGTGSASTSVGQSTGDLGEKAKQLFGQGLATVSGAFNQITSTLDEKTKTDTHPGIVTQATSAFQTGVHKVDDFLSDKSTATATTATGTTTTAQGPILTTTNTVPHLDPQGQQEVGKLL